MCWYCHWGVSKPVAAIYRKAVSELDGDSDPLEFGPAHIVWSDFNLDRDSVRWCLQHFDEHRGEFSDAALAVVRRSLEELLALPDDVLDPAPADSDDNDQDPAKYPPTIETERI